MNIYIIYIYERASYIHMFMYMMYIFIHIPVYSNIYLFHCRNINKCVME